MMLPDGWSAAKIGDLLERVTIPIELNSDDYYQELGVRSHGRGVFHKVPQQGAQIGGKRVFRVIENALVLNIVFAWEQAVGLTSEDERGFIASHRFPMYRLKHDGCVLRYVYFYLLSPRGRELLELASPGGAGRNRTLGQKAFEAMLIPCPPLFEQRRIVSMLSLWDDAIIVARKQLEKQKKEAELIREAMIRSVMKYERVPLTRLADVRTGLAKGKVEQRETVDLPYLRVANVQDGWLDLQEVKLIAVAREQVNRYLLKSGDVLMTEGGDIDKLGRGTVWNDEIRQCLHQNHVFAVRPDQCQVGSEFVAALAASEYGRNYFLSCAKRSTNLASINTTQLKAFPVPLAPLSEQERVASIVGVAMQSVRIAEKVVDRLVHEKTALMSDLLTGKRRVPVHDPVTMP